MFISMWWLLSWREKKESGPSCAPLILLGPKQVNKKLFCRELNILLIMSEITSEEYEKKWKEKVIVSNYHFQSW